MTVVVLHPLDTVGSRKDPERIQMGGHEQMQMAGLGKAKALTFGLFVQALPSVKNSLFWLVGTCVIFAL